MDSLTQLTLGAAVGEAILGRKVGNRAMVWGAIAATLPDLDVFASFTSDEISALAFHRSITHSLTYAVVAAPLLAWSVNRMYDPTHIQRFGRDFLLLALGIYALLGLGSIPMPIPAATIFKIALLVGSITLLFPLVVYLRKRWRRRPSRNGNASWLQWTWLFFGAIVTHPMLDCCTTFGTQFYRPFSAVRVAINNISVADPFYTVPFLVCVIIAFCMKRATTRRQFVNWLGIGISSAYMLFSFYNKVRVDRIFEASLNEHDIVYERYMAMPTILNNILWQGVAENDTAYYFGSYSLLDQQKKVLDFYVVPKGHALLAGHEDDRSIQILKWFTNGYYNVLQRSDGSLQLNDLRFGSMSNSMEKETDYVFKFILIYENGHWVAHQNREAPANFKEAWNGLWGRVAGI